VLSGLFELSERLFGIEIKVHRLYAIYGSLPVFEFLK